MTTMVRKVLEHLAIGTERAGRDPSGIRLTAPLDVAVSDADPEAARAALRPGLVRHLATHHPRYAGFSPVGIEVPESISSRVAEMGYRHGSPRELEERYPQNGSTGSAWPGLTPRSAGDSRR